MELQAAKYISMGILLISTLIMSLIGICLQRFVLHRYGSFLSITQRIVSGLTSGIFLGTLLMFVLPNCVDLVRRSLSHDHVLQHFDLGYALVGLGFFLICLFKELTQLYEKYSANKRSKIEKEHLISLSAIPTKQSQSQQQLTDGESCSTCGQHERMIILVFALGVHYFFNGVLVGGQTGDATTLWLILGAICFHMSLVAFSVTLRLLVDNQDYVRVFIAMLIWSIMGPLGVLFSLIVTSDTSEFNLINGILQCISAGTFLYITFIDMLHSDLVKSKLYPFVSFCLVFIGFSIIVIASIWHEHPK